MDFLKNIFGAKKDDQNNFVVDASGEAVDETAMPPLSKEVDHTQDGPVGDTKAFDDLVSQADNSANVAMPETPVVDPEFQKAQEEARQEGIEIEPPETSL